MARAPGIGAQIPFLALARLVIGRDAAVDRHLSHLIPLALGIAKPPISAGQITASSVSNILLSNKDTSGDAADSELGAQTSLRPPAAAGAALWSRTRPLGSFTRYGKLRLRWTHVDRLTASAGIQA